MNILEQNKMINKKPNEEQLFAIESHGGVLLDAGAGSGKTYVLVEHLVFLFSKILNQFSESSINESESLRKIRKEISQIVTMTFTKKAAGEMQIRLKKRIEQMAQTDSRWLVIINNINCFHIGTIHSFLMKLVRSGIVNHLPQDFNLGGSVRYYEKIKSLYINHFNDYSQSNKIDNTEYLDIFLNKDKEYLSAVMNVLNDAQSRLSWTNGSSINFEKQIEHFFQFIWSSFPLIRSIENTNFATYSHQHKNKWHQTISELLKFDRSDFSIKNSIEILIFIHEKVYNLRAPKNFPELKPLFDVISELKLFLKDYMPSIMLAINEKKVISNNYKFLSSFFKYIEKYYLSVDEFIFSDLEYFIYQSLSHQDVAKEIRNKYSYFIIDEFQDTSQLQFDLILKLIDNDLNKIYCVGDIKQAIYRFRGGDIGVFNYCSHNIRERKILKSNYRSGKNIVAFNNKLFATVFSGQVDAIDKIHFGPQVSRAENDGSVEILKIRKGVIQEKLNLEQTNLLESTALVTKITDLLKNDQKSICVLYSETKPILHLTEELKKLEISFLAKVKIKSNEDPIFAIFLHLLDFILIEKNNVYCLEIVQKIIQLVARNSKENLMLEVEKFKQESNLYGCFHSFLKFITTIGLTVPQPSLSLEIIKQYCDQFPNTQELWHSLVDARGRKSEISYSFIGKNKEMVQIMTVHSSKGLEFDHVLLAGIYSNEKNLGDRSFLGKNSGSFRIFVPAAADESFDSLPLIQENFTNYLKDIEENKRLLYVALTRAIHSICFFIVEEIEEVKCHKNSWINILKGCFDQSPELLDHCHVVDLSEKLLGYNVPFIKLPLVHSDQLGITQFNHSTKFAIAPELSATSLLTLVDCPYKFYLKNICKISLEDLIDLDLTAKNNSAFKNLIKSQLDEVEEKAPIDHLEFSDSFKFRKSHNDQLSSAERGTLIHAIFEKAIKNGDWSSIPDNFQIIKSMLNTMSSSHSFLSEEKLKFSLWGYMISAIPDIIAVPQTHRLTTEERIVTKIIDLKTGRKSEEQERKYFLQLQIYGLALFELGMVSKNDEIDLIVCYLDLNTHVSVTVNFDQVKNSVLNCWVKLSSLEVKTLSHCRACQFEKICQK
jgi:ATP-dependent exoDNAse (exonuclease V) beta subunit